MVIGPNGENVGVITVEKALQLAREAELDLVEVAPDRDPPVCRILDFGKFLYERTKKEREAKKAQTRIEIKEIRLRPKTNEHHRGFKARNARRWLLEGNKVRVTIRFRGREIDYPEIALEDLREIAKDLEDVSIIEAPPGMEGRTMTMVLAAGKSGKPAKPATEVKTEEKAKPAPKPAKPAAESQTEEKAKPAPKPAKPAAESQTEEKAKPAPKPAKPPEEVVKVEVKKE